MGLEIMKKLSMKGRSREEEVSLRSEWRLEDLADESSEEVFFALGHGVNFV